jgi:hypothetical protein
VVGGEQHRCRSFLDRGKFKAYGLGGALMLDYEKFSPEVDDDLEIRYSNLDLWVTRWRAVARYKFGPGLSGWTLGLAVSF